MTVTSAVAKPSPLVLPARPYPGLRPFEADEWMIFFGREKMTENIIERLAQQRLVFIHGASGCGKSSLVRAGVLPRLERQHLSHGVLWHTCTMRPSSGPLWNLATEFARLEGRADDSARIDEIVRLCNKRGATCGSVAGEIEGLASERLCLLVDQFEELFRFEREVSREEAELFVDLLIGACGPHDDEHGSPARPSPMNERRADVRVVVTMRSEFLGECARFDGLAEAINRTQYLVPRMTRAQLRRAIQRPAQLYGAEVTDDLAERLIAEVRGREDELPLIQHGLMLLWTRAERDESRKIELGVVDFCDNVGSLQDMLSDHADAVMNEAVGDDAARQQAVETLFRALVEQTAQNRAIRRPQTFRDLAAITNVDRQHLRAIIEAFRADGVSFLTPARSSGAESNDETIIDISHEALIRCWKKIAHEKNGWLKRETEDGIQYSLLLAEAHEFAKKPELVLPEPKLRERRAWLESKEKWQQWCKRYGGESELVERLLEESGRAAIRRYKRLAIIAALITVSAIMLVSNIIGFKATVITITVILVVFVIIGIILSFLVYALFRMGLTH